MNVHIDYFMNKLFMKISLKDWNISLSSKDINLVKFEPKKMRLR